MVKTRKMCRAIAILAVFAMIAVLLPTAAFAANTVSISSEATTVAASGGSLTVTGTLSGNGDITMLAYIHNDGEITTIPANIVENNIMYVDQKEADKGTAEFTFALRNTATGSHLTVFMGGTDVSAYTAKTFAVVKGQPDFTIASTFEAGSDVVLASSDSEWAAAVTKVTIDGVEYTGSALSVSGGNVEVSGVTVGEYTGASVVATGYADKAVEAAFTVTAIVVSPKIPNYTYGDAYIVGVDTVAVSDLGSYNGNIAIKENGTEVGTVGLAGAIDLSTLITDDNAHTYTLVFGAVENYAAIADITFNAISKNGYVLSKVNGNAISYDDTVEDGAKATFAGIPAAGADSELTDVEVEYVYTVAGGAEQAISGTSFTIDRPATGEANVTVVIYAKIGASSKAICTKTVNAQGVTGPQINEEDVVFANYEGDIFEDVYGTEGARIVEISTEEVDAANNKIKVGDVELYYSPSRNKFVGVVVGYNTAAAVIEAISVEDGESTKIFYGTVDDPTHEYWEEGDGVALADVMRALNMFKNPNGNWTIDQYISADVDQDGEVVLSDVMQILQAKNKTRDTFDVEEN